MVVDWTWYYWKYTSLEEISCHSLGYVITYVTSSNGYWADAFITVEFMKFYLCRALTCPAAEMVDGSKVLYFEQVCSTHTPIFNLSISVNMHQFTGFHLLFARHFGGLLRNPFGR